MMILAETLWKLVPEQLDDNMREVMAKIEDGPRRDHDEVWAEILAAAPTQGPVTGREMLEATLKHIDFDGMDPNTFTIAELRRAL